VNLVLARLQQFVETAAPKAYSWYKYNGATTFWVKKKGLEVGLKKGMTFGVKPLSGGSAGSMRFITQETGTSKFAVPGTRAKKLIESSKPIKEPAPLKVDTSVTPEGWKWYTYNGKKTTIMSEKGFAQTAINPGEHIAVNPSTNPPGLVIWEQGVHKRFSIGKRKLGTVLQSSKPYKG
jgi:hypothetical protein